jgi:hypothetical protein
VPIFGHLDRKALVGTWALPITAVSSTAIAQLRRTSHARCCMSTLSSRMNAASQAWLRSAPLCGVQRACNTVIVVIVLPCGSRPAALLLLPLTHPQAVKSIFFCSSLLEMCSTYCPSVIVRVF